MGQGFRENGIGSVRLSNLVRACTDTFSTILDAFIQPACPSCGRDVEPGRLFDLCESCSQTVLVSPEPACMRCGAPDRDSCICARLEPASSARAVFIWAGAIKGIVLSLKYAKRWDSAGGMGMMMAATWLRSGLPGPDMVACVPLRPARFISRGYNQAALLAVGVGRTLGVPVLTDLLRRRGSGRSTRHASRRERVDLVRGAFVTRQPLVVKDRRILLVDDVLTTGATASECAGALLRAGAAHVDVLTFARAVRGV